MTASVTDIVILETENGAVERGTKLGLLRVEIAGSKVGRETGGPMNVNRSFLRVNLSMSI